MAVHEAGFKGFIGRAREIGRKGRCLMRQGKLDLTGQHQRIYEADRNENPAQDCGFFLLFLLLFRRDNIAEEAELFLVTILFADRDLPVKGEGEHQILVILHIGFRIAVFQQRFDGR